MSNFCLNRKACMFGLALLILSLIVAVTLAFMAGPTSPLTWLLLGILLCIPFLHKKLLGKKFIQWKPEYSVGIESIDQQHKKLVNLINQLHTAIDYSTGHDYERGVLNELVSYTKIHFSYEEQLMAENDYPFLEPHKAQHQKMIQQVNVVLAEYELNPDQAMDKAATFLRQWLIEHINGTDKQYSSFLIEKGVL